MINRKTRQDSSSNSSAQTSTKTKKKVSFREWLFRGTGTVAEPWPTAEELFESKKVQREIAKVRSSVEAAVRKAKK